MVAPPDVPGLATVGRCGHDRTELAVDVDDPRHSRMCTTQRIAYRTTAETAGSRRGYVTGF